MPATPTSSARPSTAHVGSEPDRAQSASSWASVRTSSTSTHAHAAVRARYAAPPFVPAQDDPAAGATRCHRPDCGGHSASGLRGSRHSPTTAPLTMPNDPRREQTPRLGQVEAKALTGLDFHDLQLTLAAVS